MEKKIDGNVKSAASIPANYVSILQLQERWMKEKEREQKEEHLVERGVKQQVNGQRRREKEEEEEPRVKVELKSSCGGSRMNRRKKGPNCVEKEEVEGSAIVNKKDDDGVHSISKERKKKWLTKKNQGGRIEEVVKCGSKAYILRENDPVKEEIPGEKVVQSKENAACNSIAVETHFQHLRIKKRLEEDGRDREVKRPAKLNSRQGCYRNQKHEAKTMVWVKKGENNGAGAGNGALTFKA